MARQWYENWKQYWEGEIDIFNRFVYFWICLNIFYWKENCPHSNNGTDRCKCVTWFNQKKDQILGLETTNHFIHFIKERGGVNNESKREGEKFRNNNIDSNEDIEWIANCLYTVRCNLFHGDKELYNDSNIKLLQESSKLLDDILRKFIT